MTVAVSCNLAEGVVLGVDSAVTMQNSQQQVVKVYENATKLFQLGEKPIGIAIFGMGVMGNRNIGSYVREFELTDPNNVITKESKVEDVVEELRKFFDQQYRNVVVPELEQRSHKKFEELSNEEQPILGLAVGGFSAKAYLSQVWEIRIPIHNSPKSASLQRGEGNFGSNWFALNEPIFRYHKGYDRNILKEVKDFIGTIRGTPLTSTEDKTLMDILQKREYPIPFLGMPMEEGIAYVRFLVEMVINHYRFSIGAPVVGGKAQIGLVTYKGDQFRIL